MSKTSRYAIVAGASATIARYLPGNYSVLGAAQKGALPPGVDDDAAYLAARFDCVVVGGNDDAGWTMDAYVIPRLMSGLYGVREIGAGDAEQLLGVALPDHTTMEA